MKTTPKKSTPKKSTAAKKEVLDTLIETASGRSAPAARTKKKAGGAATKKAAKKAPAGKTTKKKPTPAKPAETDEKPLSNKAIVWTAWEEAGRELDADAALDLVEGRVKRTTIVGWMSAWGRGQNLPGIAKK